MKQYCYVQYIMGAEKKTYSYSYVGQLGKPLKGQNGRQGGGGVLSNWKSRVKDTQGGSANVFGESWFTVCIQYVPARSCDSRR